MCKSLMGNSPSMKVPQRALAPVADSQAPGEVLLRLQGIEAGYDSSQVLFGIDLEVRTGECITLLGRNGMGKSTLVKTIVGILRPSCGSVQVVGRDTANLPMHLVSKLGIGLVPEGRRVFGELTVYENLMATARKTKQLPHWDLDAVYSMFPRLRERAQSLAGTLSGGEQQMLAIGRALMTNPRLLILDEATEGLAPLIRLEIWRALSALREAGLALLVIDKSLRHLLELADRHYVVEKGHVVWSGSSEEFRSRPDLARDYLGV